MKDETNKKYHKLTGLIPVKQDSKKQWHWLFKCECGNEKVINAVNVRNGQTKSCGCSRLGQVPNRGTRNLMRLAKVGKTQSKLHIEKAKKARAESMKGRMHPLTGMASKLKGVKRPQFAGTNSPCWKGGNSRGYKTGYYSSEYKEWRLSIFERDDFTCQDCGKKGVYITAHHIKSFAHYPDLRFELDNGLTLCEPCHSRTDNYKGRARKLSVNYTTS